MTIYDLNKASYAASRTYSTAKLEDSIEDVLIPYLVTFDGSYYMLVNNEKHYYTLFTYEHSVVKHKSYYNMAKEVISIAKKLGDIKSIERNGQMVEFWIKDKNDKNIYMYPFFIYDKGVIKVD